MNLLKKLIWGLALGLVIGGLEGGSEAVKVFIRTDYFPSLSEKFVYLCQVLSVYGFLWMIFLFCFGLSLEVLFRFFPALQKFLKSNLSTHLLGMGIALHFYMRWIIWLNDQYLPSATSLKSIMGNLALVIALIIVALILARLLAWGLSLLKSPTWLRVSKVLIIAFAIILTLDIAVVFGAKRASSAPKPSRGKRALSKNNFNIILITIDALRPDHISAYGYDQIQTKAIDQLAEAGIVFENALSNAPWTYPSFISLLTSQYPESISNCKNLRVDSKVITLAEVLKESGWRTIAILTNPFLVKKFNLTQGFEMLYHSDEMIFMDLVLYTQLYDLLGRINSKLFLKESSPNITNQAVKFIKKVQSEKFFLWIHYIDPHLPYCDPWATPRPLPPAYQGPISCNFVDWKSVYKGKLKLNRQDIAVLEYLYDGGILFVDKQLARLFNYLHKNQLWEKSMIILSSDHGEEFYEHKSLHHGTSQYWELIHIPLIIKLPGRNPPSRVREMVELIDLAPTILDFLGIDIPKSFKGTSFAPIFRKTSWSPKPYFFSSCNFWGPTLKAIRTSKYTLIYNLKKQTHQLFDRQKDPFEQKNLAEEMKEQSKFLLEKLKEHLAEVEFHPSSKARSMVQPDLNRLRALGYVK